MITDQSLGLFLVISEVLYSENSDFQDLSVFWVKTMHSITLYAINIHNIKCLEPFLPLYDHFEIWRFLGLTWQYYLKPCLKSFLTTLPEILVVLSLTSGFDENMGNI